MTETKLAEIEGLRIEREDLDRGAIRYEIWRGEELLCQEDDDMLPTVAAEYSKIVTAVNDRATLLAQVRAMAAALRPFVALAAELEQRKIARVSRLWVSDDNDTDLGACDVYDAAAAYAALAAGGGTEEGR